MKRPLNNFQGILWSKNIEHMNLKRDKAYIIHQILAFGSLQRIKELFKFYGKEEVVHTFMKHPKKIYSASVFHFVKNFILGLRNASLPTDNYVAASLGGNRRATTKGV